MARTLNVAVHMVRREAFVEAAQRLMTAKGYEQMSIQDVLDAVEASRGAFYHYFDSNQALAEVEPVVRDASLAAPAKLHGVFSTIGRWKTARRPLVLALIDIWLSD